MKLWSGTKCLLLVTLAPFALLGGFGEASAQVGESANSTDEPAAGGDWFDETLKEQAQLQRSSNKLAGVIAISGAAVLAAVPLLAPDGECPTECKATMWTTAAGLGGAAAWFFLRQPPIVEVASRHQARVAEGGETQALRAQARWEAERAAQEARRSRHRLAAIAFGTAGLAGFVLVAIVASDKEDDATGAIVGSVVVLGTGTAAGINALALDAPTEIASRQLDRGPLFGIAPLPDGAIAGLSFRF